MIMTINPSYEGYKFESLGELVEALEFSRYEIPADGLQEGRDYVFLEEENELF